MPGTKIALEETRDETTEATGGARHALGSPAYPVVQCISAGLGPGLGVIGAQGKCGITERFELVLQRESDNANDLWEADHTQTWTSLCWTSSTGSPGRG